MCGFNSSNVDWYIDMDRDGSDGPASRRTDDLVVVPTVWGALVVLGIAGNLSVVCVMLRHGDRNATNYYVINLALTDLAFTAIVIPLTMIHYVMKSWMFGLFACKFLMYTTYVSEIRLTIGGRISLSPGCHIQFGCNWLMTKLLSLKRLPFKHDFT